jgi:hypothetical protein
MIGNETNQTINKLKKGKKMKKIVLMMALMLAAVSASAQVYVGGGLGFIRQETDKLVSASQTLSVKTTQIKILPEVGYELNERWSVGTVIGWEHSKTGRINEDVYKIAPYARYNFLHGERLNLFVDGGVSYANSKETGMDHMNLWEVGFQPGISIRLSEHFMFVTKYGFLGYKETNQSGFKDKEYGFDFDTDELTFGFHYIL